VNPIFVIVVKSSTSEPTIHAQRFADHASEGRSILSDCFLGADSIWQLWKSTSLIWRYLAEEISKRETEYTVDPREKDYDRIIFFFMGLITLGVPVAISVLILIWF